MEIQGSQQISEITSESEIIVLLSFGELNFFFFESYSENNITHFGLMTLKSLWFMAKMRKYRLNGDTSTCAILL